MTQIQQVKNIELLTVVNDGFEQMKENQCQGFEYTIGKVKGGEMKLVFEPDLGTSDAVMIDGVDGFGYTMLFEDK